MNRNKLIDKMRKTPHWDFIIIGGGASGLGTAVDSSSRGFKTILLESVDFAKGTSSRSTKLAHGGVRYLAQGNVKFVLEALKERGILSKNAAHLFKTLKFLIPNYNWWSGYYYALGLKIYDWLSVKLSLGPSTRIKKTRVLEAIPTLNKDNLKSGVTYFDGQFDDSRLAINLAQTAVEQGAVILNYMKVIDLVKNEAGQLIGVTVVCMESGKEFSLNGSSVINATGVFANKILKLNGRRKNSLKVVPSQGIHLVVNASFLKKDIALMIPETPDGRILFAVPWHGKVILGTTDTPILKPVYEPLPKEEEVNFILETAQNYLNPAPTRKDVKSVFVGLRPLVAPQGDKTNTKEISRGHKILVSDSGLISIMGGKWTTYRKMAEEVVDKAISVHQLSKKSCITHNLSIHGNSADHSDLPEHLKIYGSDGVKILELEHEHSEMTLKIHSNYPFSVAQIVWAVRHEMARTVEDVLARRIRLLFLDAKAAIEAAPLVAEIMARELDQDFSWRNEQEKAFTLLAKQYLLN